MAGEQHRHDIRNSAREKIRPYTISEKGTRRGKARDMQQFINGIFWILRTGAPAGLARGVWKLEECTPPVQTMA